MNEKDKFVPAKVPRRETRRRDRSSMYEDVNDDLFIQLHPSELG